MSRSCGLLRWRWPSTIKEKEKREKEELRCSGCDTALRPYKNYINIMMNKKEHMGQSHTVLLQLSFIFTYLLSLLFSILISILACPPQIRSDPINSKISSRQLLRVNALLLLKAISSRLILWVALSGNKQKSVYDWPSTKSYLSIAKRQ